MCYPPSKVEELKKLNLFKYITPPSEIEVIKRIGISNISHINFLSITSFVFVMENVSEDIFRELGLQSDMSCILNIVLGVEDALKIYRLIWKNREVASRILPHVLEIVFRKKRLYSQHNPKYNSIATFFLEVYDILNRRVYIGHIPDIFKRLFCLMNNGKIIAHDLYINRLLEKMRDLDPKIIGKSSLFIPCSNFDQ